MAEKAEKKTGSSKLTGFLEKNKKGVLITFIVVVVLVAGFVCVELIKSSTAKKDLAAIEAYYYDLVEISTDTEDSEINKLATECIENLAAYTKKGGIAGVRANMLSAELAYILADYEATVSYYDAAYAKGKKSYTAPLCLYNKAVALEELNKLDDAALAYKAAADFPEFGMASHAYFSYARVLETKGDISGAAEAYKALNDKFTDDDWANVAKTRLIELQAQGKIE